MRAGIYLILLHKTCVSNLARICGEGGKKATLLLAGNVEGEEEKMFEGYGRVT